MRQPSATEKYKAVNEGKMAKAEFVRQMKQQFPNLVSNYDTFDSAVKVLKYKGMIFEAWVNPSKNLSDDSVRRGLDIELATMGIDPVNCNDQVAIEKAKAKAVSNLEKDPLHYYNLLAKESSKVDKNDKMKETKRGALEKDTFNDMKKAALKEGYTEEQINAAIQKIKERKSEPVQEVDQKEELSSIIDYLKTNKGADNDIIKDFLKTHYNDIKGMSLDQIGDEFTEFESINYEAPSDFMEEAPVEEGFNDHLSSDDLADLAQHYYKMAIQSEADDYTEVGTHIENAATTLRDIEENGMSEKKGEDDGYNTDPNLQMHIDDEEWEKENGRGVNEKKGKDHDGDGDVDGDDYKAAKDKAIKKAMGKDEVALKEAVKAIITKVLDDQVINEAATAELSRIGEDYAGYEGMKSAINALENIVTDIESYYDKTRQKIQKIYNDLGELRNEEGLKVGGFLAPAIEAAFLKDLRPVTKQGFTNGLETPKVKILSKADIDAHNSGERPLGETEIEEPKQNIFSPVTPVMETKKKK